MRTFFGVALLALGLVTVPIVAGADPIGPNGCAGEVVSCDLYADYDVDGASQLGILEGNPGDYLVAYTFLLNLGADLSDGFQVDEVAHILVVHDQLFELFSNTVFNLSFDDVFTAAINNTGIDGTPLSSGQIIGFETVNGVTSLGGIGYFTTGDIVSMLVNWGDGGSGGADALYIHTALTPEDPEDPEEPPPAAVPEPGTLSLLGLGFASFLVRRRQTKG